MTVPFTINPRFYGNAIPLTAHDIVTRLGVIAPKGYDPTLTFHGVGGLLDAGTTDISYCHRGMLKNTHYADDVHKTRAGAILVTEDIVSLVPKSTLCLVTKAPYRDFAMLIKAFYPNLQKASQTTNIHPTAVVDPTAVIEEGCILEAYVVVGAHATIGKNTHIMNHTTINDGCSIGENCRIHPHVTLSHCLIGHFVTIKPGSRIGQSGFGFDMDENGPIDMPQMGSVILHDYVEIGANTCIDRGSFGDTIIGAGTRMDNLVQIAHNVKMGKNCIMVAQVGVSGSTIFGNYAMAGGQAGFAGHLSIGDGARIAAQSGVMRDIPAKMDMAGSPALPARDWHKQTIALKKMIRGKAPASL